MRGPDSSGATSWGLSHTDQFFVITVMTLILLSMVGFVLRRLGTPGETIEIQRLKPESYQFQIEINNATWVEWMQLTGIGEVTARRIVDDRQQRGPFQTIEDVQRVRGIGPKTMDAIRAHLSCRDCETPRSSTP